MSKVTQYVVLPFVEHESGLAAGDPFVSKVNGLAMMAAEVSASRRAGVVLFRQTGDHETGEWDDDRVTLFQAGRTGDWGPPAS